MEADRRPAPSPPRSPARRARRARPRSTLAALASLAALALAACLGSTGNERIAFTALAGGVEHSTEVPYSFVNDYGWQVTLSRATLTVGPLYLNSLAPTPQARRGSWLLGQAWADDPASGEGLVVGQVLDQLTIDALSPALVPFATPGLVTGDPVRTAEIFFYPPPGQPPDTLRPTAAGGLPLAAAELAGVATRQGLEVRFRGRLRLDDDWLTDAQPGDKNYRPVQAIREVRGVPALFTAHPGGRLELRIDPSALLRNADFAQLASNDRAPDDPDVVLLRQDRSLGADQVMKSIYGALHARTGTYAVRWLDP